MTSPDGQERLARTYGGAMALGAHPEASLRQHKHTGEAFEQKHAIARWAASMIRPFENILLDAGSTVVPWRTSCVTLTGCL
ncbi:DeoR/GlpR family transcriptional regulator of sugar metabolism [Arthrobacter sp. UYEF20]